MAEEQANIIPFFSSWNPRVVHIGNISVGGAFPVRIQSMTNTQTLDTSATVEQCIRMIEAGCELVRITAQNIKEAQNLGVIRKELQKRGFSVPLIADVHFNPDVALAAARLVEKVRINPGNYADKRRNIASFPEDEYEAELDRIASRLYPLLKVCQEYGTAIRIGTNHGSLSGRIMHRYGDTPEGMAESAMEFVRICNAYGFHKLILSMKSSNVRVMVEANRLLVYKMIMEEMQYPVHLGVTEAGNMLDGRIKSAAGIGTLLADGIGDTIRVSLTEAPENEIPVARQIVSFYPKPANNNPGNREAGSSNTLPDFGFKRRISIPAGSIGNGNVPVVIRDYKGIHTVDEQLNIEGNQGGWKLPDEKEPESGNILYLNANFILDEPLSGHLDKKVKANNTVLVFDVTSPASLYNIRTFIKLMDARGLKLPVLLSYNNNEPELARFAVDASLCLSPLLIDGLCDGVFLSNQDAGPEKVNTVAFAILQATRTRITQTEYIACPGCGRTQYDLEGALESVKSATSHLTGLKIAVMGCIVNGPGEMADADYGYVGQGSGKVTIYKGKTAVKKNVPEQNAVDELISVIGAHGQWKYP
jgi:(E)-4-hydroxy-3-methylbut-2-enyl-diphosphate synthase